MDKNQHASAPKPAKSSPADVAGKAGADTKPAVEGKSDKVEGKGHTAPAGMTHPAKQ